jgi:hypothetical protein
MSNKKESNFYDVVYRTKSGRGMIAKRIEAKNAEDAKRIVKKQMRASSSFDKCTAAYKI